MAALELRRANLPQGVTQPGVGPGAPRDSRTETAIRALSALGAAIAEACDQAPDWAVAGLLAAAAADLSRGAPLPPLGAVEAEARDWASWATLQEVRAYHAACWDRLSQRQRAAFLDAKRAG
jgi:hypothetical protein